MPRQPPRKLIAGTPHVLLPCVACGESVWTQSDPTGDVGRAKHYTCNVCRHGTGLPSAIGTHRAARRAAHGLFRRKKSA